MSSESQQDDEGAKRASARASARLPWLHIAVSLVVVAAALGSLLWLEGGFPFAPRTPLGWILVVAVVVPVYILIEAIGEGASEGLDGDSRPVIRLIPVVLVVLFYVLWYACRF